jgi:hypothetical protein
MCTRIYLNLKSSISVHFILVCFIFIVAMEVNFHWGEATAGTEEIKKGI